MRVSAKLVLCGLMFSCFHLLNAQDLAPRAYLITPIHSNAVNLNNSWLSGNLILDGAIPITGATAKVNVSQLNYSHSFRIWGRTAGLLGVLPYGIGNFRGTVRDAPAKAYRSGLLDSVFRLSVNIKGGPAMDAREFSQWRQRRLLGVSLKVVAPTGQYNPKDLVNFGANRWAFKPEVGLSQRWRHWILDTYGAMWFFTANHEFFSHNQYSPGVNVQTESPTAAFEGHLSYDVKPRFWASLDGNFWYGGRTTLNGMLSINSLQKNSRVGGTLSFPTSKHQSLKFSYSNGAYIRYGGDYQTISVSWQYTWVGKPN
jgi:hypothetical protein